MKAHRSDISLEKLEIISQELMSQMKMDAPGDEWEMKLRNFVFLLIEKVYDEKPSVRDGMDIDVVKSRVMDKQNITVDELICFMAYITGNRDSLKVTI